MSKVACPHHVSQAKNPTCRRDVNHYSTNIAQQYVNCIGISVSSHHLCSIQRHSMHSRFVCTSYDLSTHSHMRWYKNKNVHIRTAFIFYDKRDCESLCHATHSILPKFSMRNSRPWEALERAFPMLLPTKSLLKLRKMGIKPVISMEYFGEKQPYQEDRVV